MSKVEDVQKEKQQLHESINDAIRLFEENTGVLVSTITANRLLHKNWGLISNSAPGDIVIETGINGWAKSKTGAKSTATGNRG